MKSKANRRYYLHRCVKRIKGVTVKARQRTVLVPFDLELTDKLKELQNLNYSIQTEIY
ncbi:hypothetical protein ABMY20_12825 [Tenacibaculum sp. SSH1-16]|uniref:hypothetical protein n=1 Tax=Tenacibaculum sp. SSH1-16 TaxID=3136667 RepID=UPI0032C3E3A2